MRFKVSTLFAAISIMLLSGCLNSTTTTLFDRSTSTYQNLDFANTYTLSCYLPKETNMNYYKDIESYKLGYNQYGFYMANSLGRTDFFFYKITSGKQSLEYLFGNPGDQFNNAALEN